MPDAIELFCHGCGARGAVARVTAGLQCRCGSHDLDLWQNTPEQQAVAAHLATKKVEPAARKVDPVMVTSFSAFMTGKTALAPPPKQAPTVDGDVKGWNEYTGPQATPNQMQNGVGTPYVCPVCHGSGFDLQDGQGCRECGGSGIFTPNADEHEEVPAVARHDYPSTQTKVPFLGKRKSKPTVTAPYQADDARLMGMPLKNAACPQCRAAHTQLVKDASANGWWHCTRCGPLANIDRHPEINPYEPSKSFKPAPRTFRTASAKPEDKTGKLVDLILAIEDNNPGLSRMAAVHLARRTLSYAGSR